MKKKKLSTIIIILVFLTGLSLLLYPTVSDYWNSLHQTRAITKYAEEVESLDKEYYRQLWAEAQAYNQALAKKMNRYYLSEEDRKEYASLLNAGGDGMMGYIEIEKLHCSLPIYHGTDEAVLQTAIGHMEGTSLPVGGEGTHSVLSGHRGLPSSRLFTDLPELTEGDTFVLRILDKTLTYEVDQISTVEPREIEKLEIVEGEDYCTLVTCTPYGINTHRLLVRGRRTENRADTEEASASTEALPVEPANMALPAAAAALLILVFWLVCRPHRKR